MIQPPLDPRVIEALVPRLRIPFPVPHGPAAFKHTVRRAPIAISAPRPTKSSSSSGSEQEHVSCIARTKSSRASNQVPKKRATVTTGGAPSRVGKARTGPGRITKQDETAAKK